MLTIIMLHLIYPKLFLEKTRYGQNGKRTASNNLGLLNNNPTSFTDKKNVFFFTPQIQVTDKPGDLSV